ncbi:hypothetical protein EDB87DRAFT_764151 [Lactarius vividus]|nr:hypothetical protein EDB87DRAFT_764151 [Lactarius vividus]
MGDQYPSRPQGPVSLPIQAEAHPARATAESEVPDQRWGPCLPDLLCWQNPAHVFSQVRTGAEQRLLMPAQPTQETPPIISDACTVWPPSVNVSTAGLPVFSQSQIPEKTPLTFTPGHFFGSFGNQVISEDIPNCYSCTGYNKEIAIQEGQIQPTRRQFLERGTDGPSTPGGNVRPYFLYDANTFSGDVCVSQVPRQQWEELKEARQDPVLERAWKSESRSRAPRGVCHCTDCGKIYQRPQELKRHTRDKHELQRTCPFCCTRWSRPERIRAHLMKEHESCLTKDQQQQIRLLRGRDDTVHFLEKYGNTSFPTYTPD